MKYQITDFFRWEQPLIDQLRTEGKFVYGMRCEGNEAVMVSPRVIVNNIGFIITDEALPMEQYNYCIPLSILQKDGEEVIDLKQTQKDMTSILSEAKAIYEEKEAEQDRQWKEYAKKRALVRDEENAIKKKYFLIGVGYVKGKNHIACKIGTIVLQNVTLETPQDTEQKVMYFIRDFESKIIVGSKEIKTKKNISLNKLIKIICETEGMEE